MRPTWVKERPTLDYVRPVAIEPRSSDQTFDNTPSEMAICDQFMRKPPLDHSSTIVCPF